MERNQLYDLRKLLQNYDADLHGVALAAIQGLNQKLEQKETEITELKRSVNELKELVGSLATKVNRAEKGVSQ